MSIRDMMIKSIVDNISDTGRYHMVFDRVAEMVHGAEVDTKHGRISHRKNFLIEKEKLLSGDVGSIKSLSDEDIFEVYNSFRFWYHKMM